MEEHAVPLPEPESLSAHHRAHSLFLQGWSLRRIATEVLPGRSGGFVTVQRWSTKPDEHGITWKDEREQLEAEAREDDREAYLVIVRQVKDRNLRVAAKAMLAAEMAIDAYFERDAQGNPTGIKMNKNGNPVISAQALAPLLNAVNDLNMKTLGMERLDPDAIQQMVAKDAPVVVEAAVDPDVLKKLGDSLALEALVVPAAPSSDAAPSASPPSSPQ